MPNQDSYYKMVQQSWWIPSSHRLIMRNRLTMVSLQLMENWIRLSTILADHLSLQVWNRRWTFIIRRERVRRIRRHKEATSRKCSTWLITHMEARRKRTASSPKETVQSITPECKGYQIGTTWRLPRTTNITF